MEKKNFDLNATIEEVMAMGSFITIDIMTAIREYYYTSYFKKRDTRDQSWSFITALTDIYIAGYVSGVRAERARKQRRETP